MKSRTLACIFTLAVSLGHSPFVFGYSCEKAFSVKDRIYARLVIGPLESAHKKENLTYFGYTPLKLTEVLIEKRQNFLKSENHPLDLPLEEIGRVQGEWMKERMAEYLQNPKSYTDSARYRLVQSLSKVLEEVESQGYIYRQYVRAGLAFSYAFSQSPRFNGSLSAKAADVMIREFVFSTNDGAPLKSKGYNIDRREFTRIGAYYDELLLQVDRTDVIFLLHHGRVPMMKFNRFKETPFRFLGISDKSLRFDLLKGPPNLYSRHDLGHAAAVPGVTFQTANLLQYVRQSEQFFQALDKKVRSHQDPELMRRATEYLLFSATHEFEAIYLFETQNMSFPSQRHVKEAMDLAGLTRRVFFEQHSEQALREAGRLIRESWAH